MFVQRHANASRTQAVNLEKLKMQYQIEREVTTLTIDGAKTENDIVFETDRSRAATAKFEEFKAARKSENDPHYVLIDSTLCEVIYHTRCE